jgi:hypothetical protein
LFRPVAPLSMACFPLPLFKSAMTPVKSALYRYSFAFLVRKSPRQSGSAIPCDGGC